MNKYQQALNNYSENVDYRDYSTEIVDIVNESYDTLQELVDQTKTSPLDQVKKEWEELGYKVKKGHFPDVIVIRGSSNDGDNIIYLFLKDKTISFGEYSKFSIKEHQLLTKTFKALGWFDE